MQCVGIIWGISVWGVISNRGGLSFHAGRSSGELTKLSPALWEVLSFCRRSPSGSQLQSFWFYWLHSTKYFTHMYFLWKDASWFFYWSDCIHLNLSTTNWVRLTFNISQQPTGVCFFINVSEKSGYRSAPSHHFIANLHDFVTCFVFLTNTHVNMFAKPKGLCPLLVCLAFACLPALPALHILKMTTLLREHVKLLRHWKFQYFFFLGGNLPALYCKHGLEMRR